MSVRARLEEGPARALGADAAASLDAVLGLAAVRRLAGSRTTSVDLVALPGGERVIRKHWRWPTPSDRRKGVFRTTAAATSPAFRERRALLRLRGLSAGPFAPAPLGVWDRRRRGVLHECVLVLAEVRGCLDLARWLIAEQRVPVRRAVFTDLALRTAQMHAAGLLDGDFHPRNVLVESAEARCWVIDSPRQRTYRGAVPARTCWRDLAALDVGLCRLASRGERVRFLRAYLGARATPSALRGNCVGVGRMRARIDEREARRLPRG